jgi:hypothetical protein
MLVPEHSHSSELQVSNLRASLPQIANTSRLSPIPLNVPFRLYQAMDRSLDEIISERPDQPVSTSSTTVGPEIDFFLQRGRPRPEPRREPRAEPRHEPRRPPPPRAPRGEEYPRDGVRKASILIRKRPKQDLANISSGALLSLIPTTSSFPRDPSYNLPAYFGTSPYCFEAAECEHGGSADPDEAVADLSFILCSFDATIV